MFLKEEVKDILLGFGFELFGTSNIGDDYQLDLGNGWKVTTYCTFKGNVFQNNVDESIYEKINIHLYECIGTEYICTSTKSLREKLGDIIEILRNNSDDDEILKCPECGRYVEVKRPIRGGKWKPFLSCKGMIIQGKGKNKDVLCRGVSKKLPAEVKF